MPTTRLTDRLDCYVTDEGNVEIHAEIQCADKDAAKEMIRQMEAVAAQWAASPCLTCGVMEYEANAPTQHESRECYSDQEFEIRTNR